MSGAFILLVSVLGCGAGRRTYPVDGRIEFDDGQPAKELVGGSVEFDLIGGKTSARGKIGKDGTFRMTTYEPDDGALPGRHRVLIKPPVVTQDVKGPPADVMDRRYQTYQTSGLEVSVEEKSNRITLKIEHAKAKPPPFSRPGQPRMG
jgi:hypothetical protein